MNKDDFLHDGERLDDLQLQGYQIIQHPGCFCFGIDAVLLSTFAKAGPEEDVLDLGTGTGAIPLLLAGKQKGRQITGIEIQNESADMARRSVAYNGLEDRIRIITGDIKEAVQIFRPASFHVITSNPPYMPVSRGLTCAADTFTAARHETLCTLDDVTCAAEKLLVQGGRFYLVHRPFRLADIICTMRGHGLEPKRMRFVHPFADRKPNMVLIEGVRGGRPELLVEPPLIVYREKSVYTDELRKWYYE